MHHSSRDVQIVALNERLLSASGFDGTLRFTRDLETDNFDLNLSYTTDCFSVQSFKKVSGWARL